MKINRYAIIAEKVQEQAASETLLAADLAGAGKI